MLEGQLVILRPLLSSDAVETLALRLDFEANKSYMGYILPINDLSERRWFEALYGEGLRRRVDLAIVDRKAATFVGLIGASEVDHLHQRARFGIMIKREYWGRGYATDAMRTFFDYLFDQLNLARVDLEVLKDNERAVGLYRRFGFVQEGILRQYHYQDGQFKDVYVMGLLRTNYKVAISQRSGKS